MWEQTLQFIFYRISKNIPKKPKSRIFFQQRHHSGAHLDSGSLSQLLHGVVLRYRDVALPALLPNGAGEGRVGVSGQKDPQRAFNEEVRESLTRLAGQEGRREMSEEMERIYNMVYSEGMTAGRAEGEKIGEARGKDEGKTEIAARMLKCGRYTLEEILEMTGLTAEQVGEAAAAYETR